MPVVRDAPPADDIADRFFDSTPQGYTPEVPPAIEVSETPSRRASLHTPAVRERRRYLMRYVAGAVGLASVIGVVALVRVTTTRDASASEARTSASPSSPVSFAAAEPLDTPPVTAVVPPPEGTSAPVAALPAEPSAAESIVTVAPREPAAPSPAASKTTDEKSSDTKTSDTKPSDPSASDAARDAKRTAQRALDRGHLRQSIEAGERSVALDPTDAETWLVLGAAYQARGKYGEARRCFTSCVHLAKRGARSECRALLR